MNLVRNFIEFGFVWMGFVMLMSCALHWFYDHRNIKGHMEITGFFNVTRIFLGLLTQEIFGGNLFEDVARAQEIF